MVSRSYWPAVTWKPHSESPTISAKAHVSGHIPAKSTSPTVNRSLRSSRDIGEKFGRLDVLVNNAGTEPSNSLEDTTVADWGI